MGEAESKRVADRMCAYGACAEQRQLTKTINEFLTPRDTHTHTHIDTGCASVMTSVLKSAMTKCRPPEN